MISPAVGEALRDSGRRIVITGAGGWLGMATLELLWSALGEQFGKRVHCFGSSARQLRLMDGTSLAQRRLAEIAELPAAPTLVLHLAFLGKERAEAMAEEDYRAANLAISHTVLNALGPIGAEALFVASSGAARYADDPVASAAMRLYGSMKRADEEMFAHWAEQHGRRTVIARIFNISGPHINKLQSYALAGFILDALAGRPIRIKAPHRVVRSYVAVRELMSLVFALLLEEGAGVVRFDSAGEPMEMAEIAAAVSRLLGPVPVERAAFDETRVDDYRGEPAAYRRLLEQHGVEPVPFDRQLVETAAFLAASAGREAAA